MLAVTCGVVLACAIATCARSRPKAMSIITAPYPCSTTNLLQLQGRLVSMTARMDARFLTLTSKWKSNLSLRVSIPWHLEAQRKFPTLAPQRYGHFLVSHARQDCADDGNTWIATTMDRRATMSIARLDFCAFKLQCVAHTYACMRKQKKQILDRGLCCGSNRSIEHSKPLHVLGFPTPHASSCHISVNQDLSLFPRSVLIDAFLVWRNGQVKLSRPVYPRSILVPAWKFRTISFPSCFVFEKIILCTIRI